MDCKVISIMNKKGGVGKTTSTGTIACILGKLGLRVLVIDADPQCDTSSLFRAEESKKSTICDLLNLKGEDVTYENIKKAIITTEYKNIDIIPSGSDLDILSDKITIDTSRVPQMILSKVVDLISIDYDFILIDNSPFFNIISRNALCASQYVLVPVVTDGFSYDGLALLLKKIYEMRELNPEIDILGIFFTKVESNTRVFKLISSSLKEELSEKIMNTNIRKDINTTNSNTEYIPLPYYNLASPAVTDYMELIIELNILSSQKQKELKYAVRERKRDRRSKVSQIKELSEGSVING